MTKGSKGERRPRMMSRRLNSDDAADIPENAEKQPWSCLAGHVLQVMSVMSEMSNN